MPNLFTKKEVKNIIQARYDKAFEKYIKVKSREDATYIATHYHAIMVACVRLSEDFNFKLDTKE